MDDEFRADVFASAVVHAGLGSLGLVTLPEARNGNVRNAAARFRDHTPSSGADLART